MKNLLIIARVLPLILAAFIIFGCGQEGPSTKQESPDTKKEEVAQPQELLTPPAEPVQAGPTQVEPTPIESNEIVEVPVSEEAKALTELGIEAGKTSLETFDSLVALMKKSDLGFDSDNNVDSSKMKEHMKLFQRSVRAISPKSSQSVSDAILAAKSFNDRLVFENKILLLVAKFGKVTLEDKTLSLAEDRFVQVSVQSISAAGRAGVNVESINETNGLILRLEELESQIRRNERR